MSAELGLTHDKPTRKSARIVGDVELVEEKVRQLWKKGMKLIVVTYAETPEEQAEIYRKIHEICR